MRLDKSVKNLDKEDFKILRRKFVGNRQYLNKKLAYPYEYFNKIDDYIKPEYNLKKDDFFSKLKKNCPDDEDI